MNSTRFSRVPGEHGPLLTAHTQPANPTNPTNPTKPAHTEAAVAIPAYLTQTYWWAYLHPNAVRLFERQWLVNLILWGNFARLRDGALAELGSTVSGNVLQVACVYGDFTPQLVRRLAPGAHLSVVDVAPIQVDNLQRKLGPHPQVSVLRQDATALAMADASQDAVVLFFLLHEQPADVRRQTLAEAWRVTQPGGKLVVVDYHRPSALHPLYLPMVAVLTTLEPFAMDLWRADIASWLPPGAQPARLTHQTRFGGLYQQVVITR